MTGSLDRYLIEAALGGLGAICYAGMDVGFRRAAGQDGGVLRWRLVYHAFSCLFGMLIAATMSDVAVAIARRWISVEPWPVAIVLAIGGPAMFPDLIHRLSRRAVRHVERGLR